MKKSRGGGGNFMKMYFRRRKSWEISFVKYGEKSHNWDRNYQLQVTFSRLHLGKSTSCYHIVTVIEASEIERKGKGPNFFFFGWGRFMMSMYCGNDTGKLKGLSSEI
jgi:hypothetical protein